jgi:hypothetical protein
MGLYNAVNSMSHPQIKGSCSFEYKVVEIRITDSSFSHRRFHLSHKRFHIYSQCLIIKGFQASPLYPCINKNNIPLTSTEKLWIEL